MSKAMSKALDKKIRAQFSGRVLTRICRPQDIYEAVELLSKLEADAPTGGMCVSAVQCGTLFFFQGASR